MRSVAAEEARAPSIVVMGGGTGSFTLLQELKEVTPDITAVVNMSDDGGSTGRLRDEYGVLPPGDIRQCLVALSDAPEETRDFFNYRFDEGNGHGALAGHTQGNIMLTGLALQHGSFEKAVQVASRILRIRGSVVPVTLGDHRLAMQDGERVVRGESVIDDYEISSPNARVWLEPEATANPEAEDAIAGADIVVVAPGNFYCSILPVFTTKGIRNALQETRARKVVVANLMTKPGHTDGWHVANFVNVLGEYIGEDTIDYVLYNNQDPPEDLIQKYAAEGERPVAHNPERFTEITAKSIGVSLVAGEVASQDPHDKTIRRTLIRHDARKIAQMLLKLPR